MNLLTSRTLSLVVVPIFVVMLVACGGGRGGVGTSLPNVPNQSDGFVAAPTSARVPTDITSDAATAVASIDAGSATETSGWTADGGYSGGWGASTSATIKTSGVANAAPAQIYQSSRIGMSSYVISNLAANSPCTVRLHFAETWFARSGQRVFNVAINGKEVLRNLDVVATAGGADVAIVEQFPATASPSGTVTIGFAAGVNYPMISGIEVDGTPGTAPQSSGGYPIYSSYFTGNSPFHHTVAQLMSAGAAVRSSTIAQHYWNQGLAGNNPSSQSGGPGPLYLVKSGDPSYTFRCSAYGTCNANGMSAHFPTGATAQTGSDHHLSTFDTVYVHGEIDGWGGDGNGGQRCNLDSGKPGAETCSWGGYFPFSGNGLAHNGDSANAAGYAFGISNISAQEVLNGHIDHALGIEQSCEDNDAVYPATVGRATDSSCPSYLEPNARYGDLIHLKSWVDVGSLGYSRYCRVIVQALQTYGAYTTDNNGGYGIFLNLEAMSVYPSSSNPWNTTIFPSMAAGGDGSYWNGNFSFKSCLNRIPAGDIEVIEISSRLP